MPSIDSLLAFVVTPDAEVRRVELGPSAELEQLARSWRSATGKPILASRGLRVVASEVQHGGAQDAAGRALGERLIDPILAAMGDEPPARLYLVLDDFLHRLPIDALPRGEWQRLGDVLDVGNEVSMQRLVAPATSVAAGGTLLVLGGVDFDAEGMVAPPPRLVTVTPPVGESQDRGSHSGSFVGLRNTRYEAADLARFYEDTFDAEPTHLAKAEASKKALFEAAPEARYLHLATHGWFAPETFASMRDTLESEDERMSLVRAEETVRGFAPEALCGLALAGANHGVNSLGKVPVAPQDPSGAPQAALRVYR